MVARGSEGHGGRRHVHVAHEPVEQAGIDQGDRRRRSPARRARASCTRCRGPRPSTRTPTARCRPAGSTPWPASSSVATLDGQKVLQKAPRQHDLQARPRVHRPDELVELHLRGRRARARRGGGRWPTSASPRSATRSCSTATSQQLKIEPWEPETQRTVTVPFAWKADTLVSPEAARREPAERQGPRAGKAWPAGEPEPAAWMIDKIDPIGNRAGRARPLRRRPVRRVSRQLQLTQNEQ